MNLEERKYKMLLEGEFYNWMGIWIIMSLHMGYHPMDDFYLR